MSEDDLIRKAIDSGGGQTCDVDGVISSLDAAGYSIIPVSPRPISEYHEDMGPVLWWALKRGTKKRAPAWFGEPPYVGTPNDIGYGVQIETLIWTSAKPGADTSSRRLDVGGWPGYHTHFTPLQMPKVPE